MAKLPTGDCLLFMNPELAIIYINKLAINLYPSDGKKMKYYVCYTCLLMGWEEIKREREREGMGEGQHRNRDRNRERGRA